MHAAQPDGQPRIRLVFVVYGSGNGQDRALTTLCSSVPSPFAVSAF